jgi:hypothetical protein
VRNSFRNGRECTTTRVDHSSSIQQFADAREDHLLRSFARNNLWISVNGGQMWGFDAFTRDWRSDLDYDGFDWAP